MNAISTVTRIIAIVGAAAAVYFYFDLGNELDETQQQLDQTRQQLSQAENRLSDAQAERDELEERAEEMAANLEEAQNLASIEEARAEELESELAELRDSLEDLQAQRDEYQAEASNYRAQLIELREEVDQIGTIDEEDLVRTLQRDLARAETELEAARQRLLELEDPENDEPEVRRVLEIVRGNVADVARDGSFVVLNIGSDNNIRTGDEIMIHRDGNFVARVRVSRTESTESVAQVLRADQTIRSGDNVRVTRARYN